MDKKKIKRSGIREITWVHKAFLIAFVDILLILAAYMMALILRFDFIFSRIPREYLEGYLWSMPYWILLDRLHHCCFLRVQAVSQCVASGQYLRAADEYHCLCHPDTGVRTGNLFYAPYYAKVLLLYRIPAVLSVDYRDPVLLPVLKVLCEEERRR